MANAEWMTSLPDEVRNLPIINLAIPGSHNSMTYGMSSKSKIAPDADKVTRFFYFLFPIIVRRWAKTQSANVTEQLNFGVRYFDLRIALKNDKFYYVHGLTCMEISIPLIEIRNFLTNHRHEVVIIDFQHNYGMEIEHHSRLHRDILEFFHEYCYSTTDGRLEDCTLERCKIMNKQIIIIYRRCPIKLPKEFWPSLVWPTPWPNVTSSTKLQEFLDTSLLTRRTSQGYVSQCVLTPSVKYVVIRFFSSLRRMAKNVDKKLESWILEQSPGPFKDRNKPTVNVFIADFINLKDGQFCNWIIELNLKLCTQKNIINIDNKNYNKNYDIHQFDEELLNGCNKPLPERNDNEIFQET